MKTNQSNGNNAKDWLQELKSNRKTQGAMAMFLLVTCYFGYELFAPKTSNQSKRRPVATRSSVGQPLEPTQIDALQRLPNLARLDKAGELPNEDRMYRDLFRFDGPPPPPPPPPPPEPPPPPKPPPTPEEIAAAERKAAMDREVRGQPSAFQMNGVLQGWTGPLKGIFTSADEIHFFAVGDEATPNWKLAALNDEEAQFQNTKFEELKFSIKVQTSGSGQSSGQRQQTTNFF